MNAAAHVVAGGLIWAALTAPWPGASTAEPRPDPQPQLAAVAPVSGAVVRRFEQPDGPYGRGHRGVDLAAAPGEVVRAALAGTVRFAGAVAGETWVTVDHGDGLETTYGGVAPEVSAGARVATGQRLGRVRAGRRVLDWGARAGGDYLDPLGLLGGWRVRLVAPTERRVDGG